MLVLPLSYSYPYRPVTPKIIISKNGDSNEFGEIVSAVWGRVKGMIGFTPDCLNGGTKRLGGKCYCPEYFLGEHCQTRQCLNNGTLQRISTIPPEEICKCTNPLYITGKHCETIHCQNGGRPLTNGSCKCIDNWYTGEFCQHYAASWFAVLGIPLICIAVIALCLLGIPLICIAVIALCCVICRLDFCPKRTSTTTVHRENRRRNRGPQELRRHHHRHAYGHDDPQTLMIHENLLNDCHHQFRRPPSASHSSGQIVRLENIPVYNPTIPHLPTDEYKPLEPPPSYEQAVSNCPAMSTPILSTRAQPPPIYSPPRATDDALQQPSRPPEESPPR
uniref:EGF-like domain-containing protein n=1 Tax=Panagrolaimus sp. ES5 TaxID=591445 RepID=A0AC34FD92_9BILA